MASPFFQAPTFREFRAKLEATFHCEFKFGPELNINGVKRQNPYFERTVNGRTVRCGIKLYPDDKRLEHNIVRTTCERLKINFDDFLDTL